MLYKNFQTIQARIAAIKTPSEVRLIAVSKQHTCNTIAAAYALGQRDFGESYLQEALPKIQTLTLPDMVWHFIGNIQSNKTAAIAAHFDWVHSVSSFKIAQKLSAQRSKSAPLQACIQIQRSPLDIGAPIETIQHLAAAISALPHIQLRGLMMLGMQDQSFEEQCEFFALAQKLFQDLKKKHPCWDTLSIGMTNDLEAALTMGSTCVRIGSGLFGEREKII